MQESSVNENAALQARETRFSVRLSGFLVSLQAASLLEHGVALARSGAADSTKLVAGQDRLTTRQPEPGSKLLRIRLKTQQSAGLFKTHRSGRRALPAT